MFNGIIKETGIVLEWKRSKGGAAFCIDAGKFAPRLRSGDSIAVDGICLTVVRKRAKRIWIDVSAETLRRTNLSWKKQGDRMNLEPPITANTMISGHFVQGHVEGTGKVLPWIRKGMDVRLVLQLPMRLVDYCIPKGSIAVNGVSLTIASLQSKIIEIALIPYTLDHTNLGDLKAGQRVNIETDMIGRYVVTNLKKIYHRV